MQGRRRVRDARHDQDVPGPLFKLLDLCVSSLRGGLPNLLCIVPSLTDDRMIPSGIIRYNWKDRENISKMSQDQPDESPPLELLGVLLLLSKFILLV